MKVLLGFQEELLVYLEVDVVAGHGHTDNLGMLETHLLGQFRDIRLLEGGGHQKGRDLGKMLLELQELVIALPN